MAIYPLMEGVPCDVCGISTDERSLDLRSVRPVKWRITNLYLCQSCTGEYDDDDLIDLVESRQDQ